MIKSEATIEIGGDASGAVGALQRVADAAQETGRDGATSVNRMSRSLDSMAESGEDGARSLRDVQRVATSMGTRLAQVGTITTGLNSALSLVGRGVGAFRESMERYLRQTEDGDALWSQLERRIFAIKGALAEAVIGTDDTADGFEALDTILGTVQGTVSELVSSIQLEEGAMLEHVRGGLSALVRGLDYGQRAMSGLRQASQMAELGIWASRAAMLQLRLMVVQLAEAVVGLADQALGRLRDTGASVAEGVGRLAGTLGARGLQRRLNDAADAARDGDTALAGLRDRLDEASWEAADAAHGGFADLREQELQIAQAIDEEQRRRDAQTASFNELISAIRDGSVVRQAENDRSGEAREAAGAEAEAVRTLADVYIELRDAVVSYAAAKLDGAKAQAATIGEQDDARRAEALRLESLRLQALDSEARKAAEAASLHREEIEATAGQYEAFARVGTRALSDLAAGEDGALKAAVSAVGEELQARGASGLWEAAMMAWVPGMQAQAAGLAATSALAVAAGGIMRRTGRATDAGGAGAVSSGAVAPSQAAPVQRVSNTTSVVLNYATLASTRESQIAVAGAVRGAVANGYA